MRKFLYVLLIFMYSFSGKASDRPEDVIAKAERSFAAALYEDKLSPSLSHALKLAVSSFDPNLTVISKSVTDTISSEKFRAEREKRHDRLIHVLNAGISMLNDYLYQAKNDDNLIWTYSIFPLGKKNGQDIPLDGYEEMILPDSVTYVVPNTWFCEINRQRNCLDLNHLLGLMTFWKKTIFSNERSQSYCEINALALKFQIIKQLERRKEQFNQNIDNGLSDFGYRESLISILEDLSDAIPNQITGFVTNAKNISRANDKKTNDIISRGRIYNESYVKLNNEFIELSKKIMYIYIDPKSLFMDRDLFKDFTRIYKSYLDNISKIGKNHFSTHVIDFKNIFSTENFTIKIPYDFLKELFNQYIEHLEEQRLVMKEEDKADNEGKLFSLHISSPQISKGIYNNIIIFLEKETFRSLASTNKYLYKFCSEILTSTENKIIYDDIYWRTENEFHNKRKNNTSSISIYNQNVNLTSYEIDLFSFLKDNIFKVNRHLKKNDFVSHLSKLFFDVEVNKKGKGSLHYILPKSNNPLFGKHKDDSESYFKVNRPFSNIHLPHRNEVIPPGYFLYIQSGFKNVFRLSSDYIDDCLRPRRI